MCGCRTPTQAEFDAIEEDPTALLHVNATVSGTSNVSYVQLESQQPSWDGLALPVIRVLEATGVLSTTQITEHGKHRVCTPASSFQQDCSLAFQTLQN